MPGSAVLPQRLAFVHACLFPLSGKKRRLAMPCVPVPQVEIAVCVFSRRCGALAGLRDVGAFHAARFAFSVRPCDSVGAFCPRFTLGIAFLMQRFSSAYARLCGSVDTSRLGSRLLFVLRQTGRLAIACVSIPRVEIASCAFSRR